MTQHDSEIPADGRQVFTACAFIHKKIEGVEKVFLAKRALTKKFLPGVYEMPGGHVDFGEEMTVGLKREVKEEFQMDIEVGDPFEVFTYTNQIKRAHAIEVIYFATFVTPLELIQLNPEDHELWGWFEEKEIDTVVATNRRGEDPEIVAIKKGFRLLRGEHLKY